MDKNTKIISSFIAGAIVSVIFITASTIGGELYHPFKDWLKATFYHHWVGKGILSVAIFLVVTLLHIFISKSKNVGEERLKKCFMILFWLSVVSTLLITIFFIYEFVIKH